MTDREKSNIPPPGDSGTPDTLAAMIRGIDPTIYEVGVPLVRQGDQSESAFVLVDGTVRVVADTAYGAVPLATLSAPRLVGEIGALTALPRTASIIAQTVVTVYVVPRARLIEVGCENPQFLFSVIAQIGKQFDGMNRTLSLYSNALSALEKREFDSRILDDLANPSPQLAEFSAAFRKFAHEIVRKRRQEDELASAAIIQQSYLPDNSVIAAAGAALELHAHLRPARSVGGDFYDFFFLDDSRLAIAIGDVCGKGISASLFLSVVITVLRMTAREEGSAQATIARTNALLCRDNATSMFATVFYGVLDLRDGTLEYCNCGHNAPMIVNAAGELSALPATGLPLAIYPEVSASALTVKLSPADILVLFTDGVTEAMNPEDQEFTDERLRTTVRAAHRLTVKDVVALIFRQVDDFAQDAEQADDITCVALKCFPRLQSV